MAAGGRHGLEREIEWCQHDIVEGDVPPNPSVESHPISVARQRPRPHRPVLHVAAMEVSGHRRRYQEQDHDAREAFATPRQEVGDPLRHHPDRPARPQAEEEALERRQVEMEVKGLIPREAEVAPHW